MIDQNMGIRFINDECRYIDSFLFIHYTAIFPQPAFGPFGVERFVNIFFNKAVNPTSIMGASKHAAGLMVSEAAQKVKNYLKTARFLYPPALETYTAAAAA